MDWGGRERWGADVEAGVALLSEEYSTLHKRAHLSLYQLLSDSRGEKRGRPQIIEMMTSKIAQQLASLLKQRLRTFNRKKKMVMVVSEEEMDNIANEALEAVLGCT